MGADVCSVIDEFASLRAGQVHVWLGQTDVYGVDGWVTPDIDVLSPQERERAYRLVVAADRQRYIVSRLLLRNTLSRYGYIAPREWMFGLNANSKPHIVNSDPDLCSIQFNLSHSANMFAVAIALDTPLGIDIELVNRPNIDSSLVAEAFSAQERSDLKLFEGDARRLRMLRYWTLKEAFVKGFGMSLARALSGISFDLSIPGHIGVQIDPRFELMPEAWKAWQWRTAADCLIAMCVSAGAGATQEAYVRWLSPPGSGAGQEFTLVGKSRAC